MLVVAVRLRPFKETETVEPTEFITTPIADYIGVHVHWGASYGVSGV
jgi:hypothetical protein